MRFLLLFTMVGFSMIGYAQKETLLFADNFSAALDTANWAIEKQPADSEMVTVKNGKLLIDTYGGATVWYKKELQGNLRITYTRKIIVAGGKNDRLSDLNQFWMATDPGQKMFTRKGGFTEYDSLNMYYVGMGGNYNTTTRFRKYNGGEKKIIGEFSDSLHVLQANKTYNIEIIINKGEVKFIVNGLTFCLER